MATFYLDPSAANDGDGSTHSQAAGGGAAGAYNTLVGKTFASGDVIWGRRCATSVTAFTAALTFTTAGVKLIGWPISGDENYATRPVGAQASWDGDSDQHCVLRMNSTTNSFTVGNSSSTAMECHRVEFRQDGASGTTVILGTFQGPSAAGSRCRYVSCRFVQANANTGSSAGATGQTIVKDMVELYDCYLEQNSNRTGGGGNRVISLQNANTGQMQWFRKCTMRSKSGGTPSLTGYILVEGAGAGSKFTDCTFDQSASFVVTTGAWFVVQMHSKFDGCTWDATNSAAAGGASVVFQGTAARDIDVRRGTFTNVTFSNATQVFGILEIVSWTEHSTNAAQTFNGNLMTMSGVTRYASNVSAFTIAGGSFPGQRMVLLARRVLWPVLPTLEDWTGGRGPGRNSVFYSIDHQQNAGDWYAQQTGMKCQSTSVARTGGSSFALKVETLSASADHANELEIGLPELESLLLDLAAASVTITLYGSYKSFTNGYGNAPTKDHIWAELRYLNGSRMRVAATSRPTTYRTAVASDGSSWTGDTGLTSFKLEIPVTVGTAGLASIRLFAGWPNTEGGIIYLDPEPAVL